LKIKQERYLKKKEKSSRKVCKVGGKVKELIPIKMQEVEM
jgi:hypothetical protein